MGLMVTHNYYGSELMPGMYLAPIVQVNAKADSF